ncbi:murein DD-endopeptidase MepM/ murein hydrolase activator NlpD [Desulfofundulus luciae]|uniref:Murein DD-endopeptidase MepM/ murein hydrolase activator NlpD n=1 Tax=Desulfofundulus luciae TaxID=74702 RepID=A0ABU0AWV4_9FIRM|nr:M23 family metallopeptidase [Desulfofundulus luciae]MDQ0284968.1 murein DD-endopeptidase MepM/ murein hydrolase activator NlpD [Desulfofundulus luciae]
MTLSAPPTEDGNGRNGIKQAVHRLLFEDPLTPAQVICLVAITVVVMAYGSLITHASGGWALLVDDRVVAVCSDRETLETAIHKKFYFGESTGDLLQRVTIRPAAVGEGPLLLSNRQLEDTLARALGAGDRGTALVVNGAIKLVVADREMASRLLEKLKERYSVPGADVRLMEEVSFKEVRAPAHAILGFEQALDFVCTSGRQLDRYTVRAGDTLWTIAAGAGMTVEELQAANPGLTPERLQVGQELNLSRAVPVINVLATARRTEKREIPFPEERRRDNSMYRGQQRIIQPGKPGLEEVTYQVAYLNGREVSRDVLDRRVIRKSETRVVAVGSRMLLASRSGTGGRLAWPTVGAIESPFGPRWGRLHAGVDIAAGTSAPVRAAESGRVVSAGWNGGYGLMVDVYHGDGVITRYAHLSRIEVRVGQRVERGQVLGRVGSTGNATGPHLHFEVLVNGRPVNPARFL